MYQDLKKLEMMPDYQYQARRIFETSHRREDWASRLLENRPHVSGSIVAIMAHLDAVMDVPNANILKAAIAAEWPAPSEDEPGKMAYTRSQEHGEQGRRTKCRVGAWVERHFPGVFGGRAMDAILAAHQAPEKKLVILDDMDLILDHMARARDENFAFGSCMTAHFRRHPYRVYSARFGWKLALLMDGESPVGRALINGGQYVRAYANNSVGICAMQDALKMAGIEWVNGWDGKEIELIWIDEDEYRIVGPYLDGSTQTGRIANDRIIIGDGPWDFASTNGEATNEEECHDGQVQTEDDEWIDEDDAVYIHDYGYVHIDDAVDINGDWYLRSDPDVVQVNSVYYLKTDDDIVYSEYRNRYYHIDDVCYSEDMEDYIPCNIAIELENGEYTVASNAVETLSGKTILLCDAVCINGEYYTSEEAEELNEKETEETNV